MKTYITITVLALIAILFIMDTFKVSFNPFSFEVKMSWKLTLGWILLFMGLTLINLYWFERGEISALEEVNEKLDEYKIDLLEKRKNSQSNEQLQGLEDNTSSI